MAQIISQVKQFSDLDFGLSRNPITSDVMKRKNVEAIKSAIKNLVMTNHFERPFHPEIGSNIYHLMFENYSPLVERIIERLVIETVENFEPRAVIESVSVFMDETNAARITVRFTPVNIGTSVSFDVLFERVR
jgi:phage baseplate assembly protein W